MVEIQAKSSNGVITFNGSVIVVRPRGFGKTEQRIPIRGGDREPLGRWGGLQYSVGGLQDGVGDVFAEAVVDVDRGLDGLVT